MFRRIYYNSHLRCYSIQAKSAEGRWRVIGHAKNVYLKNARFIVSEKSRQRVIKHKRKSPHAFIEGEVFNLSGEVICVDKTRVRYNPYLRGEFFLDQTLQPIYKADFVFLTNYGVFI